jgi:hypothetical protein
MDYTAQQLTDFIDLLVEAVLRDLEAAKKESPTEGGNPGRATSSRNSMHDHSEVAGLYEQA